MRLSAIWAVRVRKNLLRRPLRTMLTVLGVMLSP
jgi:hypothetical protein